MPLSVALASLASIRTNILQQSHTQTMCSYTTPSHVITISQKRLLPFVTFVKLLRNWFSLFLSLFLSLSLSLSLFLSLSLYYFLSLSPSFWQKERRKEKKKKKKKIMGLLLFVF